MTLPCRCWFCMRCTAGAATVSSTGWKSAAPQFTTLDTHDGIGVVDVADLLSEEEIEETREALFTKGANVKKVYNTCLPTTTSISTRSTAPIIPRWAITTTPICSRGPIQFFAPGIPQVYYVGLLAGENDIALMESTKQGRDINRHYYAKDEVRREADRPVVRRLFEMMRLRNTHPAFHVDGDCRVELSGEHGLTITRHLAGTSRRTHRRPENPSIHHRNRMLKEEAT